MSRKESIDWKDAAFIESTWRKWIRRAVIVLIALCIALPLAKSLETKLDDGAITFRFRKSSPFRNEEKTSNDLKVLISTRNPFGMINVIDVDGLDARPFNPTILQLPTGAEHEFIVIVRLLPVVMQIGVINEEPINYALCRQVAFFADMKIEEDTGRPYLKRAGDWVAPVVDSAPIPGNRCHLAPIKADKVGPEDMRVFWTRDGAPLLLFTHQAAEEGGCQNTFVIDARMAIEPLADALAHGNYSQSPIKFSRPWQLQREYVSAEIREVEKNWEPFQTGFGEESDDLFFSTQMTEPRIYKYEDFQKYIQYVRPSMPSALLESSEPSYFDSIVEDANMKLTSRSLQYEVVQVLEEAQDVEYDETIESGSSDMTVDNPFAGNNPWDASESEQFDNNAPPVQTDSYDLEAVNSKAETTCIEDIMGTDLHQATPILRVTLCNRGECLPSIHNTVLFGLIHKRNERPHLWYDRRIVTWNITSPFEYRSVSKRLVYPGARHDDYVWTGSMTYNFDPSAIPLDRSHGYLDDEIWLAFGIKDAEAGWLDVDARQLLDDHHFCQADTTDDYERR